MGNILFAFCNQLVKEYGRLSITLVAAMVLSSPYSLKCDAKMKLSHCEKDPGLIDLDSTLFLQIRFCQLIWYARHLLVKGYQQPPHIRYFFD
jgi:hypothetical protein